MDPIKEAFERIKQDIFSLKTQLQELNSQISQLKVQITNIQTNPAQKPTYSNPLTSIPAHIPAHPTVLETLKDQNNAISTGNRGVPTDKPTDKQTNQQTDSYSVLSSKNTSYNDFERAKELLDSLDNVKKEIRLKFKRLTPQEMQVFSTLYSLEEQNIEEISYKILSQRLNLTESSIRDYITKLVDKGIPIIKIRQNNKKITLTISKDLQKVASLSTIIKLREI